MNKRVIKAIVLLLVVAIGMGSCKEHKMKYKHKFRTHRDHFRYRGAGHSF